MPEDSWFYELNGRKLGPVSEGEVIDLIAAGIITDDIPVWKHGFPKWQRAGQTELARYIKALAEQPVEPMPPPPSTLLAPTSGHKPRLPTEDARNSAADSDSIDDVGHRAEVKNGVVWLLALAPLLGRLGEYMIAGVLYGSGEMGWVQVRLAVVSGKFWYVTLLLNCALSWVDYYRLEKRGVPVFFISGWAVWLVPVYLYKRAKAFGHDLSYFATWMVLFLVVIVLGLV